MNSSDCRRQRRLREESYQIGRPDPWKVMTQTRHTDTWRVGSAFLSCKQEGNKNFNRTATGLGQPTSEPDVNSLVPVKD